MNVSTPLPLVLTDSVSRLLLILTLVLLFLPELCHADEKGILGSSLRLAKQPESRQVVAQVLPESIPAGTTELEEIFSSNDCSPLPNDPPLFSLTVDITPRVDGVPSEDLPIQCPSYSLSGNMLQPCLESGSFCYRVPYCWESARFFHKPLYFEDWCLERCGETYCCCQPLISAIHFFGGVVILPLKIGLHPACRCVRTPACY